MGVKSKDVGRRAMFGVDKSFRLSIAIGGDVAPTVEWEICFTGE